MIRSIPKLKDIITEDIEKTGGISDRHARHFTTIRNDFPSERWEELTQWRMPHTI